MANKKRLIELGEAFRMVQNSKEDCPETSIKGRAIWTTAHNCALSCLTSCDTVDAVEVVHAEWACVNESENVWMCTGKNGCGNAILLLEGTPDENGWHYCPGCGAKMDGGNEDGR